MKKAITKEVLTLKILRIKNRILEEYRKHKNNPDPELWAKSAAYKIYDNIK